MRLLVYTAHVSCLLNETHFKVVSFLLASVLFRLGMGRNHLFPPLHIPVSICEYWPDT